METTISWILPGLLAALLVTAIWFDLRSRTIPNTLNLAIALLAIPFWWATGLSLWPDAAIQLGVGGLVFGLFTIAFALGGKGGGDVKLVAAIALWLPWEAVIVLLVLMSLAGGVLTLVVMAAHRARKKAGKPEIPYGVAIAFGGLVILAQRFLNQFA